MSPRLAAEREGGAAALGVPRTIERPRVGSMRHGGRLLRTGGLLTAVASLLHVAIILGGPDWYRFFGAGEGMARLAASGSIRATLVTAGIAAILAVWALYALSGAGVIRRLPFLRPALALIAAIFLARGFLGIPLVMTLDGPYLLELRARTTFMVVSSAVCLALGLCYAVGALGVRNRAPAPRASRTGAPEGGPASSGRTDRPARAPRR